MLDPFQVADVLSEVTGMSSPPVRQTGLSLHRRQPISALFRNSAGVSHPPQSPRGEIPARETPRQEAAQVEEGQGLRAEG